MKTVAGSHHLASQASPVGIDPILLGRISHNPFHVRTRPAPHSGRLRKSITRRPRLASHARHLLFCFQGRGEKAFNSKRGTDNTHTYQRRALWSGRAENGARPPEISPQLPHKVSPSGFKKTRAAPLKKGGDMAQAKPARWAQRSCAEGGT